MAAADGGKPKLEIRSNRLLLVEGRDELNLFDALLRRRLGAEMRQNVQIIDVGGKDQFPNSIAAISVAAVSRPPLRALAVIRDADDDAEAAFRSVCDGLRRAGYAPPAAHGQMSGGNPSAGVSQGTH